MRHDIRLMLFTVCYFLGTLTHAQNPSGVGGSCKAQLDRALEESRIDAVALPPNTKPAYRLATIQFRPNDSQGYYVLYLGKQTPEYQGTDVSELVRRLNGVAPISTGGTYYIAFDGFPQHRSENLVNSLRLQLDSGERPLIVEPIFGDLDEWSAVTLKQVTDVEGEPEIHPLSDRPGWFEGTQTIIQKVKTGVQQAKLRVQSTSRLAIQSFFTLFRNQVAESKSPRTLVDIVSSTKAEMKRTLKLNDTEFRALVLDQTNRSYIVELITSKHAG